GHVLGRHRQVFLVLPLLVVDDEDEAAAPERARGLIHRRAPPSVVTARCSDGYHDASWSVKIRLAPAGSTFSRRPSPALPSRDRGGSPPFRPAVHGGDPPPSRRSRTPPSSRHRFAEPT